MRISKTKRNLAYNLTYQMLLVIIPFILTPYVSRVLGAENIGIYAYTYSVANYFVLIAMLGMKNYGNRCIARTRDNRRERSALFCNLFAMQIATSILMVLAYLFFLVFIVKNDKLIAGIQLLFVLTSVTDVTWFFFGIEEFKTTVTRNILIKLVNIIGIFLFVKTKADLWIYTLVMSAGWLGGYVSVLPLLHKHIDFIRPTWIGIRPHIRPNLKLFISVVAISIFNIMDKILLGQMSNMIEVGLFENTEKLMRIPFGLITALGTVMLPKMSNMVLSESKEGYNKLIEKSIVFTTLASCAMAFGLAGVGKVFAPLFFGKQFIRCGTLIMWISPTILALSWANVIRMQYLIPNEMDKEFTVSTLIGAGVNLGINVLLIPLMGATGAIIGTLCAEFSLAIYQTYIVRRYLPIRIYIQEVWAFLLFGTLMFATVYWMGQNMEVSISSLMVQIGAGATVYLLCSGLYIFTSKRPVYRELSGDLLNMLAQRRYRHKKPSSN